MKFDRDIKDVKSEITQKKLKEVQEDMDKGLEWKCKCKALFDVNKFNYAKIYSLEKERFKHERITKSEKTICSK